MVGGLSGESPQAVSRVSVPDGREDSCHGGRRRKSHVRRRRRDQQEARSSFKEQTGCDKSSSIHPSCHGHLATPVSGKHPRRAPRTHTLLRVENLEARLLYDRLQTHHST